MRDGKVRDALNAVGADERRHLLARQERREALTAPFDRRRVDAALDKLAAADRGATP